MVIRFLTLLLAVIVMTGVVAQGSAQAGPASALVIDQAPDAPDLDPVVLPICRELVPATVASRVVTPPVPAVVTGRRHAVVVFRPPRLIAAR